MRISDWSSDVCSSDLVAMKDRPKVPFLAPPGVRMVRIERRTGRKVFGVWPSDDPKSAVIWEAFKPESEPRRVIRRDELARSEEHTSELQSLMRISYAVFCLKKKHRNTYTNHHHIITI